MIPCQTCERELDPQEVHDDHEPGCPGEGCSCDLPKCFDHCSICQAELADDDFRYGLLVTALVVFVALSWTITAAYYLGRGGDRLEQPVRAGETSDPVIYVP